MTDQTFVIPEVYDSDTLKSSSGDNFSNAGQTYPSAIYFKAEATGALSTFVSSFDVEVLGSPPDVNDQAWWSDTNNVVIFGGNSSYQNDIAYKFRNANFASLGDFSSTPDKDIAAYSSYQGPPQTVAAVDSTWTIWNGTQGWNAPGNNASDRQVALNALAAKNIVWG